MMIMKKGGGKSADPAALWRTKHLHSLLAIALFSLIFIPFKLFYLFKPSLLHEHPDHAFFLTSARLPHIKHTPFKFSMQAIAGTRPLLNQSSPLAQVKEEEEPQYHANIATQATQPELLPLRSLVGTEERGDVPNTQRKIIRRRKRDGALSLQEAAQLAWRMGRKAWKEVVNGSLSSNLSLWRRNESRMEPCPESTSMNRRQIQDAGGFMPLLCGLMLGSSITVIGKPRPAHYEYSSSTRNKDEATIIEVSQFLLELHDSGEAEAEETQIFLHVNPRSAGDWSNKQVIEQNTFYKGQWGVSQRCDGSASSNREETVDGLVKCEKWLQHDEGNKQEPKASWWLHRLAGGLERNTNWKFPFTEGSMFVLTIRAGWEGYHISVNGRHTTSFSYRTGVLEEEVRRVFVGGDVDVESVIATSLPSSRRVLFSQQLFEAPNVWRAPELPKMTVDLFIGVLSASNHFAERMSVRKTWMQSQPFKDSKIVARFLVALHPNMNINSQIKRESDLYGDMVILPLMDHYQLVVLKTIAICEYGVRNISTKFIMKCDDDTFIIVEEVLKELKKIGQVENLYLGNINMFHKPLRTGKWAVTFEEWPDEVYPPYANGPGYIITYNIAKFIVTQHKSRTLKLFKMEDVSMGLWVRQFNTTKNVKYVHTWKFLQAGCENGYITAHYQTPRQMLCLWEKLLQGTVQCCNLLERK